MTRRLASSLDGLVHLNARGPNENNVLVAIERNNNEMLKLNRKRVVKTTGKRHMESRKCI